MSRRFWLYAVIAVLVLANGFVFYRLASLYLADTQPPDSTAIAAPEPASQRQQTSKPNDKQSNVIVPILMYHYIRVVNDPNDALGIQLSVSPLIFKKQLQKLKDSGYETISLADFADDKVKKKSIVLTFDDGYSDHFTDAYPILKEMGMTGTFFIVKGFIGRDQYMSAKEITELADGGMEIGGHSLDHHNLATQDYATAYKEIHDSLRGTDPVFAYPSGKYSAITDGIIRALGVKATVTTNLGVASAESDFGLLPRIRVKEATDIIKVISEQTYLLQHPEIKPTDPNLPASQAN